MAQRGFEGLGLTSEQAASLKFGRSITNRKIRTGSEAPELWSLPTQDHGSVKLSASLVPWPGVNHLQELPFLSVRQISKAVPELQFVHHKPSTAAPYPLLEYPFTSEPHKFTDKLAELFYFEAPKSKKNADGEAERTFGGALTVQGAVDDFLLNMAFLDPRTPSRAYRPMSLDLVRSVVKSLMSVSDAFAIFQLMPVDYAKGSVNLQHGVWIEFTSPDPRISAMMRNSPNRVGCLFFQVYSMPAMNDPSTPAAVESKKRSRTWTLPKLVVIPRRDMANVNTPTAPLLSRLGIPVNYMSHPIQYYALPAIDAYEFKWASFQWQNAVLLGQGARGSVVRTVFTPNAPRSSVTLPERRLLDHYHTQKVEHALPDDEVHVVVALKLALYAPFFSTVELRMEYALAILCHTLPKVTVTFRKPDGSLVRVEFDDYHMAPCYGYVTRRQYYGLIMKLFPYEFGEALAAIAILKHNLKPGTHAYVAMAHAIREQHGKIFSQLDIVRIFHDIFHILAFLHGNGFVHRDVKPANILMTSGDFRGMLSDFGMMWPMGKYTVALGTRIYQPQGYQDGVVKYTDGFVDVFAMAVMMEEVTRQIYPDFFKTFPAMERLYRLCLSNSITAAGAYYVLTEVLKQHNIFPTHG